MGKAIRWTLAAALLGVACSAQATLITWTLQNVTFNDGGTASGFFTIDQANANHRIDFDIKPIDFDIKTTAGTLAASSFTSPFEYTPANSSAAVPLDSTGHSPASPIMVHFLTHAVDPNFPNCNLSCGHVLTLEFYDSLARRQALPAVGGTVLLFKESNVLNFEDSWEQFPGESFRYAVAGSMNGVVPEPSSFAFLGVGLGLMLFLRKRLVER